MDRMEQLVQVMRRQGRYHNPPGIHIGIAQEGQGIRYRDLLLKKSDYLLPEGLAVKKGDRLVFCYCEDRECYLVLCKVVGA